MVMAIRKPALQPITLPEHACYDKDAFAKVVRWLTDLFATGEAYRADDVRRAAKERGFSTRTLNRAKTKLEIGSYWTGNCWAWARKPKPTTFPPGTLTKQECQT